jgi:hypothetical protein
MVTAKHGTLQLQRLDELLHLGKQCLLVERFPLGKSCPKPLLSLAETYSLGLWRSMKLMSLLVIKPFLPEPKGFGRIRLRRITDASERQVIPFVKDVIQAGSEMGTVRAA